MNEALQELKLIATILLMINGVIFLGLAALWLIIWIFHLFFITLP